jgi:hypothetical protein
MHGRSARPAGARGGSIVREWRAKRQMAEGAGNQFEVKTNRPPRRRPKVASAEGCSLNDGIDWLVLAPCVDGDQAHQ